MKAYAKFNSIPQANKYDLYKVGNEETPIATLESSESGILEIEILNPVKGDSYYLIATDVNGNYINSPQSNIITLTGPLSFEIDCTPSDAIITINGKENNNVGLVPNTTLVYKAEKTGYWYKEKEVIVTEDHVEPVVLQYPTDVQKNVYTTEGISCIKTESKAFDMNSGNYVTNFQFDLYEYTIPYDKQYRIGIVLPSDSIKRNNYQGYELYQNENWKDRQYWNASAGSLISLSNRYYSNYPISKISISWPKNETVEPFLGIVAEERPEMWFIIEPINADSDDELKSAGFIGRAPEYCTMNDFFGSNQGTLYIDNGHWEEGMTLEEYVATCDTISPSSVCYYSDFTSSGYDKAWLCGIPSGNTGTIYAIGNTYELDGLIHPEEVLFWEEIAWS